MRAYTIVYTPYGPQRDRLNLTLDQIELQDEATQIGIAELKPIHTCEDVVTELRSLQPIRIQADRTCFGVTEIKSEELDTMGTRGDHRGEEASDGEATSFTQMATQVVHQMRPPIPTTETPTDPPINRKDSESSRAALLALLSRSATHPGALPVEHQRGASVDGAHTEPGAIQEGPPDAGSSIQAYGTEKKSPHVGKAKAPTAGGFARSSANRGSDNPDNRVALAERSFRPTRLPPLYQESGTGDKPPLPVINYGSGTLAESRRKGISDESQGASSSEFQESQSEGNTLDDDTIPSWLENTCNAPSGFGRVPKLQMKLMSSWQKHRAGTNDRFPDANIPINILKALKRFEIDAESSDSDSSEETGNAASDADTSKSDKIDWSSSPERPSRVGPNLPPDTPGKNTQSQENAQSQAKSNKAGSSQKAQRVVVINSSNEDTTMNFPSSPPIIENDDDDVDMEMELDIPRGLGEEQPPRDVSHSPRSAQRTLSIVQVKETPYPKKKITNSSSVINPITQTQQQTSSGTSKNTSSTTIVHSTYVDAIPVETDDHGGTAVPPTPKPVEGGHREVIDLDMEDAPEVKDATPVKRKLEISPSKNGRRPSKRRDVKLIYLRGKSPKRDPDLDLQRERQESLRRFSETAKAVSVENSVVDNDTRSGALEKQSVRDAPSEHQPPQHISQSNAEVDRVDEAGNTETEILDIDTPLVDTDVQADDEEVVVEETVPQTARGKEIDTDEEEIDLDEEAINTDEVESVNMVIGHTKTSHAQPSPSRLSKAPPVPVFVAEPPKKAQEATQSLNQSTIFGEFKRQYPAYEGDMQHFARMCRSIDELDRQDKSVPQWLWDDFIICHLTEYMKYVIQCHIRVEQPEPYHRFYKRNTRDIIYAGGVIGNRNTLVAAISESIPEVDATMERDVVEHAEVNMIITDSSPVRMSRARSPAARAVMTSLATRERRSPSPNAQKKTRPSLPSTVRRVEKTVSPGPASIKERSRASLPTTGKIASSASDSSRGPPRASLPLASSRSVSKAPDSSNSRPRTSLPTGSRSVSKALESTTNRPGASLPTASSKGAERSASKAPDSCKKRPRASLPPAFNKAPSAVSEPGREALGRSLPGSSGTGRRLSSLTSSNVANQPQPAQQANRLSTPNSTTARPRASLPASSGATPGPRPSQTAGSGPRPRAEPTGDKYRDFLFAQSRVTSITGDSRVGVPPRTSQGTGSGSGLDSGSKRNPS